MAVNAVLPPQNKISPPFFDCSRLIEIVDDVSLLGGLNEEQLSAVVQKLRCVTFSSGEFIYKRGEQASYIYIVLSGTVRLLFASPSHPLNGHQYVAGHCFGEASVIGIQNHSGTTQALSNVELLILSREDLMSIFEEDQTLFGLLVLNIAREACRRLNNLNDCIENSYSESGSEKPETENPPSVLFNAT